jgi:hypothetical protein
MTHDLARSVSGHSVSAGLVFPRPLHLSDSAVGCHARRYLYSVCSVACAVLCGWAAESPAEPGRRSPPCPVPHTSAACSGGSLPLLSVCARAPLPATPPWRGCSSVCCAAAVHVPAACGVPVRVTRAPCRAVVCGTRGTCLLGTACPPAHPRRSLLRVPALAPTPSVMPPSFTACSWPLMLPVAEEQRWLRSCPPPLTQLSSTAFVLTAMPCQIPQTQPCLEVEQHAFLGPTRWGARAQGARRVDRVYCPCGTYSA